MNGASSHRQDDAAVCQTRACATDPLPAVSSWLGWSGFLASSWTWCIGMFLPALLMRDFGIWGWIVFAVPNVIGAAAMGWTLRSADQSESLSQAHRGACMLFSGVTIAFHLFFVVAVLVPLAGSLAHARQSQDLAMGTTLVLAVAMYLYMTRCDDADRVLAWSALLVSAAIIPWVIVEINAITTNYPTDLPALLWMPRLDLLWLAPVCMFGFFLCPYLDLTFHRTRQRTNHPRAAFGTGFGVLFFVMIVFTLIYGRAIIPRPLSASIAILLFAHMTVQSAFTLAAHAREIRYRGGIAACIAAVLTVVSWLTYWLLPARRYYTGLGGGEVIYRAFMGFYGLVFPAYVWLVMIPCRSNPPRPLHWVVLGIAVLAASPMFWMGFVAGHMVWLVPGLALLLAARLLAPAQQNSAPI